MYIRNIITGENIEVIVLPIEDNDFKTIRKNKQFQFDWENITDNVHKLCVTETKQILGLISLRVIANEFRVQIMLLEVTGENVGKKKAYDKIAGILIAYACKIAYKEGCFGFVSLLPKTALKKYYIEKYGFMPMGNHLYTDGLNSRNLISNYL